MKKILSVFALFCGLMFSVNVSAQKLPFQGRLLQDQQPVNATLDMVFSIDTVNWTETHTGVVISNGLYSVVLGEINPLPVDLFNGFSEHQLKITIGGTALTPVKIYPAISKGSGGIGTRYSTTGSTTQGDTAVFYSIDGGADSLQYYALRTTAQTIGSNVGTYSRAISSTGNGSYQVGSWGRAAGEGTAYHYGVIGQANSVGVSNLGVYGSASGAGNGYQGYDSGSYNTGVNGYATGNSWGNTGVFGNATGTQGVDNIGVVGWSSVGADTTENKGVLGWAKGVGVNKGVMGMATGGKINWSGWFDGDFYVRGKHIQARVDSITLNDVNGRQAIVLESMFGGSPTAFIGGYGPNGKGNFYLSSGGHNRSYGNLTLKDSIGVTKAWLSAYHLSDGRAYGLMSLYGPDQKGWIGTGFKGWQADTLANLPYIHLEGNIPNVPLVNAEVNSNGSGVEEGQVQVKSTQDNRHFAISPTELFHHGPNSPNIQMGGKPWENMDLANINLFGNIPDGFGWFFSGATIDVGSNAGQQWGNISLQKSDSATTSSVNTVEIAGNLWGSNGGGIILKNDTSNMIELYGNNGTGYFKGSVYVENGTYVTSDERYKTEISTLSGALQNVKSMRGVTYILKEKPQKGTQIGVIAQEVEEVYPELVNTGSDGYKSVNYAQMVAVLIEAVKELNAKIETLEKDNNRLNNENNDLKAQLEGQMNDLKNRLDQFEKLLPVLTNQNSSSNSGSK